MESPAWIAVIEQVPAATVVMSRPETVQIPVELEIKVTVNPDDAVAAEAKVVDGALAFGLANVIACGVVRTVITKL